MSAEPPESLSEREQDLLRSYRASISPTRERKNAAWVAVGPLAKATGTAMAAGTKLAIVSAIGATVALGGVATWVATRPAEPPAVETRAADPVPADPPRMRGTATAADHSPTPAEELIAVPQSPSVVVPVENTAEPGLPLRDEASRTRSRSPVATNPTTVGVEAEVRSLKLIRAAFSSGDDELVLSRIRSHRATTKTGVLAEEVDALEVMVLCQQPNRQRAATRLATFNRKYPTSPQSPALERACEQPSVPVQRPSSGTQKK